MPKAKLSGFKQQTNEERKEERKKMNEPMTEFPDKAEDEGWRGKMEYEGDGRPQVEFFKNNTNVAQLVDGMTPTEASAFRAWTRGEFMTPSVWKGWENMSSSQRSYARIYDSILDRATLNKGLIVNRLGDATMLIGKRYASSLSEFRGIEGNLVNVKSFMSCAAASEGLHIGDTDKNVQLRIHIPSGSTGAGMWVGHSKINSWGVRQREFMTNRDIVIRVGKTTYNSSSGIYTVNVYYEGRTAHDYGKKS